MNSSTAGSREMWKCRVIVEDNRDEPDPLSTRRGVHCVLQSIGIGPRSVFEGAGATGTHEEKRPDPPASGQAAEFTVFTDLPRDPVRRLFMGERVFLHTDPQHEAVF